MNQDIYESYMSEIKLLLSLLRDCYDVNIITKHTLEGRLEKVKSDFYAETMKDGM